MSYPVELILTGKPVLIVGGGAVAARRVDALIVAGAEIRVVSPHFVPELQQRTDIQRITAEYSPGLIARSHLVFACTDDPATNARVAADARVAGILCSVADDAAAGDFLLPAVLRRGPLAIAVCTGGASPALAARIRDGLESQFPADSGMLVEELQRVRGIVRQGVSDPLIRRTIHNALATPVSADLLRGRGRDAWRTWAERLIADASDSPGRSPS